MNIQAIQGDNILKPFQKSISTISRGQSNVYQIKVQCTLPKRLPISRYKSFE